MSNNNNIIKLIFISTLNDFYKSFFFWLRSRKVLFINNLVKFFYNYLFELYFF